MSSIVTFYSYKGGVGRSMALANVAILLARRHLRVLAVDFDLEAPGLERYFSDFNVQPDGPGLLRMFMDARDGRSADYRTFTSRVDCDTPHPIVLLTSGREHDPAYSQNLAGFDWDGFYENRGGAFVEDLRNRWRNEFDIVLIDSRTDLSDTGGICTIQLPDVVVAMFTANYQSLYGVRDVMRLAQRARQALAYDRMPLAVLPLPARWGVQEFQETQLWLERVTEALAEFYEDWLPRTLDARDVVERLKVPQSDYFGFGERLAVVEQGTSDPQGMGFIYDKVASFLASDFSDVTALVGTSTPRDAERAPESVAATVADSGADRADYLYDVFVSHDRSMPEFVLDFVHQLKDELSALREETPRIFVDVGEVRTRQTGDEEIEAPLHGSKVLIALLTPRYIGNPGYLKEALIFEERARQTGKPLLIPVIIRGEQFPEWLRRIQSLDLRRFPVSKTSPSRRSSAWQRAIMGLAEGVNTSITTAPQYDRHWALASAPSESPLEVSVWPVDLNLVTGDRTTHPDLGPTINMTCRLSNASSHAVSINYLAMTVSRGGEAVYQLAWHLLYSTFGREHVRMGANEPISVAAKSVLDQGIQFRDVRANVPNIWAAGAYQLQLLGWMNRKPDQPPSLRTTFRATIDSYVEGQMTRWWRASAQDWDALAASDRALGFPVSVTDIRMDVPADDAGESFAQGDGTR